MTIVLAVRLEIRAAIWLDNKLCCCTVGVFSFSAALLMEFGRCRASKHLHWGMLVSIFRLPLAFFDTTPLGRIINRFGKDMDTIDNVLSEKLNMWWRCLLQVVATVLVISMSTPIFLAVIVPLGVLYFFIQVFCSMSHGLSL